MKQESEMLAVQFNTRIYNTGKVVARTKYRNADAFTCPVGLHQGKSLHPVLFSFFINEFYKQYHA